MRFNLHLPIDIRVYRENHNQIPSAHKWKVYNSSLATSGCTIL